MEIILFNLAVIIVLEYAVLLAFFRREWLPCLQFSALVNAITLSLGLLLISKLGIHFVAIMLVTALIEATAIYFFWIVKPAKAIAISLVMNIVSAGFFPLANWLGIHIYPF